MKNIILTLIIALCLTAATRAQTDALPTLRGDEAVNRLKQTGTYESLLSAVRETRQDDGQIEDLTAPAALAQTAKLNAPVGDRVGFGDALAIEGDTVFLGATGGSQGAVYIFTRNGTVWTQQAKIVAVGGSDGDSFGRSLAVSNDTLVVGAFSDSTGATAHQGAAYIFVRTGATWTQQAKLLASDGATDDEFGRSVGISGDTVVVGASGDDVGANYYQGSAYIFNRSGAAWTQQAHLLASDGAANHYFGGDVAVSGSTAIIGAVRYGSTGSGSGAAYIFVKNDNGVWTEQRKLEATDGAGGGGFGGSVAIEGDTAVVGAFDVTVPQSTSHGAAYVFNRSGNVWTQQARLIDTSGIPSRLFGESAAISGSTIVIGASYDNGFVYNKGSAHVFVKTANGWRQKASLTAADAASGDNFGRSVAVSGDFVLAGAPYNEGAGGGTHGSAYIFRLLTADWLKEVKATNDGGINSNFGSSVALEGDTAIVGAPDDRSPGGITGAAYIFTRRGAAWTRQARLTASDGTVNSRFGASVAIDGDRVVIGSPAVDAAYVFIRTGTTWRQFQRINAGNTTGGEYFGASVGISGVTIVVGANSSRVNNNQQQGAVYVYSNRYAYYYEPKQRLTASDGAGGDRFGGALAIDDTVIVIGSPLDDIGASPDQGSAYIFGSSGGGWVEQAHLIAADGESDDYYGASVAVDRNTIVIGAPGGNQGANFLTVGAAYVYVKAADWAQQAKLFASDGEEDDVLGTTVAIDNDTIIAGAPGDDINGNFNQGSAYVFERRGTTWTRQAKIIDERGLAMDSFGAVGISGDKIIVGARGSENIPRSAPASGDDEQTDAPALFNQGAVVFYINATGNPIPDYVSISGTATSVTGKGLSGVMVTLRDLNGGTYAVRTNRSGYFRFDNVKSRINYTVTATIKNNSFNTQNITVYEDITGLDFVANF